MSETPGENRTAESAGSEPGFSAQTGRVVRPKWKTPAFVGLKLVFAGAVLFCIFRKVDAHVFLKTLLATNPRFALAGVLLDFATILIAGWRWKRLLTIVEIDIPLLSSISIVQIGQFFLMFLPGPAGDDLTRMLYISRIAKGRVPQALSTVVVDRCIGLAAILLLAMVCIPGQWKTLAASRDTRFLAGSMLASAACVVVAALLFFGGSGRRFHALLERVRHRLPPPVFAKIGEIHTSFSVRKRVLLEVALAAFFVQFILCVMFWCAGKSVGINIAFWPWLGFVPIVLAGNAVPVTIAGLGIREYLMVIFLGVASGIDGERALGASLVAFFMMLTINLFGGIVYLFYRTGVRGQAGPARG